MFKVLAAMLAAVGAGYLLRNWKYVKYGGIFVKYVIWLLLFLLGLSVGSDSAIVGSLHTAGLQALVMAVAGMLGAMVAAWVVYKVFYRKDDSSKK